MVARTSASMSGPSKNEPSKTAPRRVKRFTSLTHLTSPQLIARVPLDWMVPYPVHIVGQRGLRVRPS